MTHRILLAVSSVFLLAACDESPSEPVTYEPVSGTYDIRLSAPSPSGSGRTLGAVVTLRLVQDDGMLSGTFSSEADYVSGIQILPARESGSLRGSSTPGASPVIRLTVAPRRCPNLATEWTGYLTVGSPRFLEFSGVFHAAGDDCSMLETYRM